MSLASEIAEQPAVAARLLGPGRAAIEAIADRVAPLIRDRSVDHVVVAARGSSDHAAIYAQYLFGVRLRLPVALATPSIVSIYGVEPRFDRSLVIGISQSGRSPDIVEVVAAARRQGAPTVALSNDPASDLAVAAEHAIDLGTGPGARRRRDEDVHGGAAGDRTARDRARTGDRHGRSPPDAEREPALAAIPDGIARPSTRSPRPRPSPATWPPLAATG